MAPPVGNRPRLPRNLRADLDVVDRLLQDITTKLGNIADLGSTFKINTGSVDDLSNKISSIAKLNTRWAKTLDDRVKAEKRLREESISTATALTKAQKAHEGSLLKLDAIEKKLEAKRKSGHEITEKMVGNWKKIQKNASLHGQQVKTLNADYEENKKKLEQQSSVWGTIGKLLANEVLRAVDEIGKTILAFGIDSLVIGLTAVKTGVFKIYDLVNRTVKAVGEFNEGLGGTTTGLRELQKEGWQLEGALRGLSDAQLGIGLKELKEATAAFGFADASLGKFRTTAVLAGKALGIGSSAAGDLARTFKILGHSQDEVAKNFVEVSDAANMAGVPVSSFAKEIDQSKGFLASFGRAGRKVFLESAAFARKLGVSLQTLQKFTDMTDTFESSAEAAAKLNTVFGTNINALDLMLEQDPSKRLEQIRRSFKEQGKTFEGLSRQERKFFAQTLQLSEEEAAGVLESGLTLDEFAKKRENQKRSEAQAQKEIQRGLLKTVSTLNNWSLTFDRITMAFMPLLKEFTDFLGITTKIDKSTGKVADGWVSFSTRVNQVVGRIKDFFKAMGENKQITEFIETISSDFKDLFGFLTDNGPKGQKSMQQLTDGIGAAAGVAKDFYNVGKFAFKAIFTRENVDRGLKIFKFIAANATKIVGVWAGLKLLSVGSAVFTGISGLIGLSSSLAGVGAVSGGFSSALKLASGALGTLAGGATRAFTALSGSLLGQAGLIAAAGAAGWALGRFIGNLEVGGKKIDDWVVLGYEKIAQFGNNLWKAFKESKFGRALGLETSANEYFQDKGLTGIEQVNTLLRQVLDFKSGKTQQLQSEGLVDKFAAAIAEYSGGRVSETEIRQLVARQREINKAGKAGPPVPATVSPSPKTGALGAPVSGPGGNAPTNFAGKPTGKPTTGAAVTIVAGDVYLDGDKVGQHLGRLAYEGR